MSDKDKVFIFDTTMRDGEQSPGASMSLEEKIQISRIFDELGIDIIEAGFPIASPGDFEAVTAISKILKNSIPCGLSRASKKDIDACHEALKAAPRFRIHTFISTSPLHMKHKLNKSPEQVLDAIKESVSYARNLTDDVEWSCEDGTRTDMDFMCKIVELAISSGAKTINIPDTVGYTVPSEFTKIISTLKNKVPNIDKAILSVHCHNDLGLAVANSLAGVSAGARQVECTINGIGERAGNAALEEIVMAIRTRNDLMPYTTGIKTELLSKASKIVSNATFPVQFNKAIVGKNAFAHEAGIHQDGMLKNRETYEIMTPESVGVKKTSLVMGKHSGIKPAYEMQSSMMNFVKEALVDADVLLYMVTVEETELKDEKLFERIKKSKAPLFVLINKIDLSSQELVEKTVAHWQSIFPKAKVCPISALTGFFIPELLELMIELA